MGMQDALTKEVKDKVHLEMMEVLKKNNLPHGKDLRDAVHSLIKEVSAAHQNNGR
jgi:hypothetical protein